MDKIRFSHTEKALVITLIIELLIVALLFQVGLKSKPKEKAYAMEFIDDNFDFDELKPEEKIELPDISQYTSSHKSSTNIASNALQEDKIFEEFKQHHENALKEFYENRNSDAPVSVGVEKPEKKKEKEPDKRYSGESNIKYYIKNRRDVYLTNPLYTCPKYMSGVVVINIMVDRSGKVISAKFNKKKSTTHAACLIDNTIQAALDTYFNADNTAPELQQGYITYRY